MQLPQPSVQFSVGDWIAISGIVLTAVIPMIVSAIMVWHRVGLLVVKADTHEANMASRMLSIDQRFREGREDIKELQNGQESLWRSHSVNEGKLQTLQSLAETIADGMTRHQIRGA